jgi:cold shock CspA family protein
MQLPVKVTYRDVPRTEPLDTLIREKARRLERFCRALTSCRIAIERPQWHQRAGNPFRVRIDLTASPGHEIVVARTPMQSRMHDDLSVVVNRAFRAAARRLKALAERQRGDVKARAEPRALVVRLFPEEGYGFVKTPDGRDIYMHRNSVLDDWGRLAVGTEVRFAESLGEMGPQASSVRIVGKPGVRRSHAPSMLPPPRGWEAPGDLGVPRPTASATPRGRWASSGDARKRARLRRPAAGAGPSSFRFAVGQRVRVVTHPDAPGGTVVARFAADTMEDPHEEHAYAVSTFVTRQRESSLEPDL